MIVQPDRGTRNVNDMFYEAEKNRIDLLNQEFFQNVEFTKAENEVLVWLCGWDEWTINAIVAAFRKVRGANYGHEELMQTRKEGIKGSCE